MLYFFLLSWKMMVCNTFSNNRNKSFRDIVLTNCTMTWLVFLNNWFLNIYYITPTESKRADFSIMINYMNFIFSYLEARSKNSHLFIWGRSRFWSCQWLIFFKFRKEGFIFSEWLEAGEHYESREINCVKPQLSKIILENDNFHLLKHTDIHSARLSCTTHYFKWGKPEVNKKLVSLTL